MPIAATSVVSAAVIGGDLILGLSDGAIINAGRVQGPTGLTGPQGPMGATGRAGTDGNTIHTVAGAPDGSLGRDGDFAINSVAWEIYGPKAGGTWGTGTPMLGGGERNQREVNKGGSPKRGPDSSGDYRPPIIGNDLNAPNVYPGAKPLKDGDFWVDGNGGLHVYYLGKWNKVRVYSDAVLAAVDAPTGSAKEGGTGTVIADAPNGEKFANQLEYNGWLYDRVDREPILSTSAPAGHPAFPVTGLKDGDFWINADGAMFYWDGSAWKPIKGSDRAPIYSDTPPTEHPDYPAPDNVLKPGDIWFDTDNELEQHVWDGTQWVSNDDRYVNRSGDTMTGTLTIKKAGDYALNILNKADNSLFRVYTGQYSEDVQYVKTHEQYSNNNYEIINRSFLDDYLLKGYLPLTGGTLTGNLNVGGQLKVSGENEFKVEYSDGTNFFRVRPDNSTVTLNGDLNGTGSVKGSELVSTKLTSGQSSNLQIYRGHGPNEERKMLIGSDSVNFDVNIRLVGSQHKDIQLQNGSKIFTGSDEIITFGGSGAFYRGTISVDDHIVNKAYADGLVEDGPFLPLSGGTITGELHVNKPNNQPIFDVTDDVVEYQKNRTSISQMGPREIINAGILENLMRAPNDGYLKDYLPLTGGELTGQLTIKRNTQVALEIIGDSNTSQIKFWSSGAVALQNYTAFKDNELVTKKYTDDAIQAAVGNVDLSGYLPLTGGQVTGPITSNRGSGEYALRIEQSGAHRLTIWNDGVIESTRTGFSDSHLVTKKYVDDNAGGITPGDQVAKTNGTSVQVGGFYITMGNLYVRVS